MYVECFWGRFKNLFLFVVVVIGEWHCQKDPIIIIFSCRFDLCYKLTKLNKSSGRLKQNQKANCRPDTQTKCFCFALLWWWFVVVVVCCLLFSFFELTLLLTARIFTKYYSARRSALYYSYFYIFFCFVIPITCHLWCIAFQHPGESNIAHDVHHLQSITMLCS